MKLCKEFGHYLQKIRQETTNSIFEEVEFMLGLTIQLLNSTFQINLPESTRVARFKKIKKAKFGHKHFQKRPNPEK